MECGPTSTTTGERHKRSGRRGLGMSIRDEFQTTKNKPKQTETRVPFTHHASCIICRSRARGRRAARGVSFTNVADAGAGKPGLLPGRNERFALVVEPLEFLKFRDLVGHAEIDGEPDRLPNRR